MRIGSNLKVLTYCPNCSWDLFFANRRRFTEFAKIRSLRKFSRSLGKSHRFTHSASDSSRFAEPRAFQ
ncbi:MAG: hypothetical protein PV344_07645, partial [Anaplasma sp.]|nr:hypothetical protein [Anaplasma sp.]